jgi:hypothetical protein
MLSLLLLSASAQSADPFLELQRDAIIDTCYKAHPPVTEKGISNPDSPERFKACINKEITKAKGFSTDGWSDIPYPNHRAPTDTANYNNLEWCYDQKDFKSCYQQGLSAKSVAKWAFKVAYTSGPPIDPSNAAEQAKLATEIKDHLNAQFTWAAMIVRGLSLERMIGCMGINLAGARPPGAVDAKAEAFMKCSGLQ